MVDNSRNVTLVREETLSASNGCEFFRNDPVIFKIGPLDHEQHGRITGRTYCTKPVRYDIESADGKFITNVSIVRLDEEAAHLARVAEGIA